MQINNSSRHGIHPDTTHLRNEVKPIASLIDSSIVSDVQDVCQEALCQFANYMFYAGWENPTLGKLVSGTVCTAMGVSCVVKSQIPQQVFHWFTKSDHKCEEEGESSITFDGQNGSSDSFYQKTQSAGFDRGDEANFVPAGESVQKFAKLSNSHKNATLLALGTLTTMYGVYHIATGLYELFMTPEVNEDLANETLLSVHAPSPSFYPQRCQPDEEVLPAKAILSDILECPTSVSVLEGIIKRGEGLINIKDIGGKGEESYDDFHGMWVGQSRMIYVKESLCGRNKLATILYEILNANTTKGYDQIHNEAKAGSLNREDFTKRLEEIGYANRISHHQIVQACVNTNSWDPRIDIYRGMVERYKDFESFWEAAKNSPHSNLYRDAWNKEYKQKFCSKRQNRKATECSESVSPQYRLGSQLTFKDEL